MEQETTHKEIVRISSEGGIPALFTFHGFKPPTSNTTYTPNQFFDVVIPHFSRGAVRIVGFLLRKTLGWCDANGNPQEEQIEASYGELERKAGVSRDMIRSALDDALSGHLIECVREGRPKLAQDAGQSALYSLQWSDAIYTTRRPEFTGFFEGEGNRTDIPNEFFDVVIPREPLSVIKVVGSIIRHSIGFQTKHGRRRQQVALSYQQIQNYARFGSRSDLAKAVQLAQERNYIIRLEEGVFSPYGHERKRATYAVRWADFLIGQKNEPASERSEIRTSIGQISEPADRSENRTSIKTKPEKETGNKHAADSGKAFALLKEAGFADRVAGELANGYPLETIEHQIAWLPHRSPKRPQGMLRKAIENNWPEPARVRISELTGTAGFEFARHFYAAFGGNRGEPVNEPSPRDADMAEAFVKRLEAATGTSLVTEWARALGNLARGQKNPFPSLQLAIRQLGDSLLVRMELDAKIARQSAAEARWTAHEEQFRPAWLAWLAGEEERIRRAQPDDYTRFLAKRERDRDDFANSRSPWSAKLFAAFDTSDSRLRAVREFFSLPDFRAWDAEFNSNPFNPHQA